MRKNKLLKLPKRFKATNPISNNNFLKFSQAGFVPTLSKRKDFTPRIKRTVLQSQNMLCRNCWMVLDIYEFDHIDGNRENNYISNCQAFCPNCHARKTKFGNFYFFPTQLGWPSFVY